MIGIWMEVLKGYTEVIGYTLVDRELYSTLSKYRWHMWNNFGRFYDKGVEPIGRQWRAKITHNKKFISIGYFATEIEAALAYDKAAIELHGEFASVNFPEGMKEVAI